MRILIVEDDPSSFLLLKKSLVKLGVHEEMILHRTRLHDAADILKHQPFDLIFLDLIFIDLRLPDSGYKDTLQFIQNHPKEKIIIYSGADEGDIILDAMKSGALHFMSKSHFRIADLERALQYAKG